MSLPQPSPARKLNRVWLFAPFVLTLIAFGLWSVWWVRLKHEVEARMDAGVIAAGRAGYRIAWQTREVGGYPFRLDVTLTSAGVTEASGWALQAPRLEAEAPAYAPTSWVIAATRGLTFVRPEGGPVNVTGKLIRASLTHPLARPPSVSVQGEGLSFATPPEAGPFALTSAERAEFHLRAGPDDEGGVFFSVTGGRARPSGLFARVAGDKPIALEWNSTLSKMSAFAGSDWPGAVRHWTDAGGRMTVRKAGLTAGDARIDVGAGSLSAGSDGRLAGTLDVSLRQAPRALGAMAETGIMPPETADAAALVAQTRQGAGDIAKAALTFQAGAVTLGPVAVGPSPKVYAPR